MATAVTTKEKAREEKPARAGYLTPFADFPFFLSRMRDDFDRMFERFARDWPVAADGNGWRWGVDVKDEDDKVIVNAEAPGFEPADFDVSVSDTTLTIRASKKVEKKSKEGKVEEYRGQECYECMTLPAGIDKQKVDAKYHNGILTITMAKTPESKAKKIPVQGK